MPIEDLLAALTLRARAERERLTSAADPTTGIEGLQAVARLAEERRQRDFLREDAKQRLKVADAARVAAVLREEHEGKEKATRGKASYLAGLKLGMGEPDTQPPEDFDPDNLNKGITAGRLMKDARNRAAIAEEKKRLQDALGNLLRSTGGDPRPLLEDPDKLRDLPGDAIANMRKLAKVLDSEDRMVGARDFDEWESGERLRLAEDRLALSKERMAFTRARWEDADAKWRAMWERGERDRVLREMEKELDDIGSQVNLGRGKFGEPIDPVMDRLLRERYGRLLDDIRRARNEPRPEAPAPVSGTAPAPVEAPAPAPAPGGADFSALHRLVGEGKSARAAGDEAQWKVLKADFDRLFAALSPEDQERFLAEARGR